MKYAGILRAIAQRPWAIERGKLEAILDVLEMRVEGLRFSHDEIVARVGETRGKKLMSVQGNVAVLPLYGVVAHRMDMFTEMSGGTSTDRFGREFDAAVSDPNVGAIVLDVDSPGGSVAGVPELAAKIHAARGKKPIVAVANSLMASAAYWIASAADEIVATPSADVGSIGVYSVHTDATKYMEKEGVKREIIRAGRFKVEANPFEPLSEEARDHMQAEVDEVYGEFLRAVATHRGATIAQVKDGYGEGRTLSSRAALASGMVDRVATLEQVIGEMTAQSAPRSSGRRAASDISVTITPTLDRAALESVMADLERAAGYVRVGDLVNISTSVSTTGTTSTVWVDPNAQDGTSTGEAVDASQNPPLATEPAPEARSVPMSGKDTAATNGAAPDLAAERLRMKEIREIARAHNVSDEQVDAAIDGGLSVDAFSREVLNAKKAERASAPVVRVGATRETTKPWANFGEQIAAVIQAYTGGERDGRLMAATGMSQGVPSEGGYLVAPQFSQSIWDRMNESPDNLLARTDSYTVEGESLTFNANAETSRVLGSRYGGVQGYWLAEAEAITASKPKFRQMKLEPQQLGVAVYLTDKLLRNAGVALQQYVSRAAADEIQFLVGDAIVRGHGAGQPKGILAAAAKVEVAKETSQAADTINQINISKMWARLHPRFRANAVWLHNVDIEPQLDALSTVVRNVADSENVGGYANKVFDAERRTLKGRPLIASEYCATLGDAGDLILVDLSAYATGVRGGIESAISMHVKFLEAEQVLRFMFEVDGQNWLASALTPFKGSNTLSNIVTLAARA